MSTSSNAPIVEQAAVHPVVAGLKDFPDRISPMIVKELRQGLRTRAFTSIFIVLQVLLGLLLFFSLVVEDGDAGTVVSNYVLGLFSIVAVILQPLRGANAVAEEMKADTLEIMSLTRLSSFRIVFGKWISLVSQTALIGVAILPYLVMRYFFGGMQLFSELLFLFTIFWISAAATAVTVGLSCNRTALIRVLVPIIGVPMALAAIGELFFDNNGVSGLSNFFALDDAEDKAVFSIMLLISAFVGYYFMDMGVSRIAPLAENHSTRKRLISVGLMSLVTVVVAFTDASPGTVFFMLVFVAMIGIDVCSEFPACLPSQVGFLARRGVGGRMLGRFLYPGWHTGLNLLLFLYVACLFVGEWTFRENIFSGTETGLNKEVVLAISGVFYAILGPLLIVRIFWGAKANFASAYLISLCGCLIATGILGFFISLIRSGESLIYAVFFVPGSFFYFYANSDTREMGPSLVTLMLAICWVLLWGFGNSEFALTKRAEKAVTQDS